MICVRLVVFWASCTILLSCVKPIDRQEKITRLLDENFPLGEIRPLQSKCFCITTFGQMAEILQGTERKVRSVILENATEIPVSGTIDSMFYYIAAKKEESSIFRSSLLVYHHYYGYLQTHFQDVWSAGCVYQNSVAPPLTEVIVDGKTYAVNTCFYWGVPPLGANGYRIRYVVLE